MEDVVRFEKFVARCRVRMAQTLWRILDDINWVEEILQQAMLRAWRKRELLFAHANPVALMRRICLHMGYDFLRAKIRREKGLDKYRQDCIYRGLASPEQPIEALLHAELMATVRRGIAQLPGHQQLAVQRRLLGEQSYAEIAQVIGCEITTARLHFWRGKRSLRKFMQREGYTG